MATTISCLRWESLILKIVLQMYFSAHPNVKAFISHGGMLSNLESVYQGVPIIGIPMFADQKMNVNTAVSKGYAIRVPYQELTEQTLSEALNEILYNSK